MGSAAPKSKFIFDRQPFNERSPVIAGIPGAGISARQLPPDPKPSSRRNKVWELSATLHCSIVGTCLTTGELRSLLRRFDASVDRQATDHDLHAIAVTAVGRNSETAKQIQKSLDQRHKPAISSFGRAGNPDELRQFWADASQGADIPGAYWALLTHPLTTHEIVRHAFGDVHMLSHLVGASNRADIHRLHELERKTASLEETIERQQNQLRDGIVAREAKIRELNAALSMRIERERSGMPDDADHSSELSTLDALVADLRKQLDLEIRRRERAEKKAQDLAAAHAVGDATRIKMEEELAGLRDELEAAEDGLAAFPERDVQHETQGRNFAGLTILYVGGRTHHIASLRSLIERASGRFIHHDGGIEESSDLLPGLVSRADIAVCPVDCVSHAAALMVKRLCRQDGKPFIPLRTSGIASLLRAIKSTEFQTGVFGPKQAI